MAKTRRPGELPPLPQVAAPAEVNPPPAAPATPTPPAGAPAPAMAPVAPGTSPVPAASASGALRARGSAPADPLLGTLIGERYRLIERIGSGGMAAVYRGEHDLLKKPVAVKLLLPELAVDQEMAARFEREAIAAARLDHPNCVAITDFGRTPRGQLFLVMEFLDGRPLSEASGYGKRLPWERAVEVGRQILRGLARAHEMGIVHRDLKASNIMIVVREGGRDVAKIIDFGIAKIFDGTNAGPHVETKAGIVFGTADFLAPERLLGKGDADPRSDLYSVGIILYEMCTGTRPFHTEDPYEIVRRALVEPPALPSTACPEAEIPRELEGVILKALEKEPERRYASAREFLQALDPIGRRAQSTTGYLTGKAPERVSPLASLATSGPERPGESLSDQFFAQEPAADDSSRVGGALAASQSLYPPLPGARPGRAAVWLWGGLVTTSVVLIGLAIMYSMGGKSDRPLDPGAQVLGPGPGGAAPAADPAAELGKLVRQCAEGKTVDERQSAFDRMVALGYYDRVPWVDKLSHDLEQLPTCEERREVVAQLQKLKDPAALPAIAKASARKDNECLRGAAADATAAITAAPPAPAAPEAKPATGTPPRKPPVKKPPPPPAKGHF